MADNEFGKVRASLTYDEADTLLDVLPRHSYGYLKLLTGYEWSIYRGKARLDINLSRRFLGSAATTLYNLAGASETTAAQQGSPEFHDKIVDLQGRVRVFLLRPNTSVPTPQSALEAKLPVD